MRRPIAIVSLISAFAVAACAPAAPTSGPAAPESPDATATAGVPATASPAPAVSDTPVADRIEAEIEIPGSPDAPLAAFDSIWVIAPDLPTRTGSGSPTLLRLDPTTNEVVATFALPDRLCQGFTASADAIWACSANSLVRIDPAVDAVDRSVPISSGQGFYQPASGGGMVWALGSTSFVFDTVIRLDPATNETASFPQSGSIGGLVYAFDALWLTVTNDGSLVRLDPATGEAEVIASGLEAPTGISAGDGSLWVSLHGADGGEAGAGATQLVRVDPATGDVLAEFAIGGSPKGGVSTWANDEMVLVRSTTPWLARIDPATNEITERMTSPNAVQGPLTVAFGSIWTIEIERDVLYRLRLTAPSP
jgi:streptogramin lyase